MHVGRQAVRWSTRFLLLLGLCVPCNAYFVAANRASAKQLDAPTRPFCIGVAGGTASGKSTVVEKVVAVLSPTAPVAVITQDCFYKQLEAHERALADAGRWNFDHPNAFDFAASLDVMRRLHCGTGQPVSIPEYDFKTHSRLPSEHDTIVCRPQALPSSLGARASAAVSLDTVHKPAEAAPSPSSLPHPKHTLLCSSDKCVAFTTKAFVGRLG